MMERLIRPLKGSLHLVALITAVAAPVAAEAAERGEITVVGRGLAAARPEMTRMQIDVTSICYDTSREAKDANAALANQVLTVLRNFADGPDDKIVATGGANVLQTETTFTGTEPRVLCELKWRSTNTLILEVAASDEIPDLQDQVLAAIDARAIDPTRAAQTFAEMGQPGFFLSTATQNRLKREAHTAAYDDARSQFDAFNAVCQFQDPTLSRISPPEYAVYGRKEGAQIPADSAGSTPIIPDDIAVDATWTFVWTFEPGGGCPL